MQQLDDKTGISCPGVSGLSPSDQELNYASQASNEFSKNNFENCLAALDKLKATRNFDVKIMCNRAVAEYFQSGLTKTEQFKTAIQELRSRVTSEEYGLDDDDYCYIHYNWAVYQYFTKQYSSAIVILEKIWNSKDNLDESIFCKVFSLMMDLYIQTYQPHKALILSDIFEDMQSKLSTGIINNPDLPPDKHAPFLAQQRLRCHLIKNSVEQAKKEVKLLNQNTAVSQILKANFELLKQNHRKSIILLNSCLSSFKRTKHLNVICYNNIGVNYFNLQKFNLAHLYFAKALEEGPYMWKPSESAKIGLNEQPLDAPNSKKHFELLYNLGVILLHCGQPQMAFDCLLNVVQAYSFNPRLWLRLAECCTRVYKQRNDEDCNIKRSEHNYIGTSVHRKGVLESGVRCRKANTTNSGAIPVPTLEFASLCLENALNCIDNLSEEATLESCESDGKDNSSSKNSPLFISAAPSNPIREDEVNNLRCSILALKSYVALCLKNFVIALNASESLLQLPDISGIQRYLGQMYKAEALMSINKVPEGILVLSPEDNIDSKMFGVQKLEVIQGDADGEAESMPPTESSSKRSGSTQDWYPYDVDQVRAIRLYNCAVLWLMKGDRKRAKSLLDQSIILQKRPLFAQMHYLEAYLALDSDGKSDENQKYHFKNVLAK